jgi:hypothetical protein
MPNVCNSCGTAGPEYGPTHELENKYKKFWRPIAAYVYLLICFIDFAGMPIYMQVMNQGVNTAAFAEVRLIQDPAVQLKALDKLDLGKSDWRPLTLEGGGLFHLAFGAILGVSAWTRGTEKTAAIQQGR